MTIYLYNLSDPTFVAAVFRKDRRVDVVLKHRRSPGKLPFEFEEEEERGSVSMVVKIFGVTYSSPEKATLSFLVVMRPRKPFCSSIRIIRLAVLN